MTYVQLERYVQTIRVECEAKREAAWAEYVAKRNAAITEYENEAKPAAMLRLEDNRCPNGG